MGLGVGVHEPVREPVIVDHSPCLAGQCHADRFEAMTVQAKQTDLGLAGTGSVRASASASWPWPDPVVIRYRPIRRMGDWKNADKTEGSQMAGGLMVVSRPAVVVQFFGTNGSSLSAAVRTERPNVGGGLQLPASGHRAERQVHSET